MPDRQKPTIRILGKPIRFADGEAPPPLVKIGGKERLTMPSPAEAAAQRIGEGAGRSARGADRPGLTIEIGSPGDDGTFPVTAASKLLPGKTVRTQFTVPFTEKYQADVIDRLQGSVRRSSEEPVAVPAEPDGNHPNSDVTIEVLGQRLFHALFKDGLEQMYADTVESATSLFPISLVCADESVCRLPWEFMHDGRVFVCTNIGPLFRVLPDAPPTAPEGQLFEPLRLLMVATNPIGTIALGWHKEVETVSRLVQGSKIEMRVVHSIDEFKGALTTWRPHVVHFIGHGSRNELRMENDAGYGIKVGRALGGLMLNLELPPRLILLNACDSGGLAAELVRSRIPMAVGMQFEITDPAAQAFAKGFYEYACAGLPLHKATAWGRLTILTDLGEPTREWATPIVYVNPKKVDLT